MCLHPDVQRRAQAEIDEKVGRDRLPSFDDMEALVYVKAVMKEVLRWAPVTPIGEDAMSYQPDDWHSCFSPYAVHLQAFPTLSSKTTSTKAISSRAAPRS